MLTHFKRICSVIDQISFKLNFEILQLKLQFSQQSNAESVSLEKDDSQLSQMNCINSADITSTTFFTQTTVEYKRSKLTANVMLQQKNEQLRQKRN